MFVCFFLFLHVSVVSQMSAIAVWFFPHFLASEGAADTSLLNLKTILPGTKTAKTYDYLVHLITLQIAYK